MSKINNKISLITLSAIIFLFSCTGNKEKKSTTETKQSEKVKVMPIVPQTIENTLEFTSSLIANEEIFLAPASPGRIDNIYVEIGTRFTQGDLLFIMDQTQLHQAQIQFKNLEVDMARFDTLIKTNSIPKQQYDQIKTQYDIAKKNVQFLEENSRLKAPFNGVVSGKYYQNGEMFSGAPNTPVGKSAVISIVQINPLKAIVSIPERYYPNIKIGMETAIITDVFPNKPVKGRILRIYPTIDQLSRTFQVEISVPNPTEELRPGMFCRANFYLGKVEATLVPSSAVLKVQGSNERYIFVEKDGKAKRYFVELGKRFDDQTEIISNEIKQGDNIIISGQARLVDDVDVSIVE